MPQHFSSLQDTWGFDEAELQTHRSGWLPEDFGRDWRFHIVSNAHLSEDGEEFGAMWAIYQKSINTQRNQTFAFSPSYEIDRDSAIFQFSHSQESAEIISNGYTRLSTSRNNKVEYGSNVFYEGVILKHKPNSKIRLTLFSYFKLAYFNFMMLNRKKNLSFFNLNNLDKKVLRRI
jgi:hypothetical protein